MKRVLYLLFTFSLILSLTACGSTLSFDIREPFGFTVGEKSDDASGDVTASTDVGDSEGTESSGEVSEVVVTNMLFFMLYKCCQS